MEIALVGIGILLLIILIYLCIIATLCAQLDPDLEPIQKWGQTIVVWLVPFFGACFILHIVGHHSPEVTARFYIPWPFKNLVANTQLRSSNEKFDNEEIPGIHVGRDIGGSGGFGGGD